MRDVAIPSVVFRRDSFCTLKSSSISVKEGPPVPRRRSHRVVGKMRISDVRGDSGDSDAEADSLETQTSGEFCPGEH